MISDRELSEIYDLEYTALLELREKNPKVYAALQDALKLKDLREILAAEKANTLTGESDQRKIPDVHDRRSARR